jgi:nicotinate-nucleotide adenylyltransferase
MCNKILGIFGGTFDPVHLGHINAVNELNHRIDFEKIHWVLSARPPHKEELGANIEQRFEMLQLALSCFPNYIADDCEIARLEKSYTFYTVQHFHQLYPDHELCLIIGMDSLRKLPTWHRYDELLEQAHIVAMTRPGYDIKVPESLKPRVITSLHEIKTQPEKGVFLFEQPNYLVSSTHIRSMLSGIGAPTSNSELAKFLPQTVIEYIQTQGVYAQTAS